MFTLVYQAKSSLIFLEGERWSGLTDYVHLGYLQNAQHYLNTDQNRVSTGWNLALGNVKYSKQISKCFKPLP